MAIKKPISLKIDNELIMQLNSVADRDDRTLSNQINRFIKIGLADYVKANNLTWDEENEQYISSDDNTSTKSELTPPI